MGEITAREQRTENRKAIRDLRGSLRAVKSSQVFGEMDHPNDEDLSLGAQEERRAGWAPAFVVILR